MNARSTRPKRAILASRHPLAPYPRRNVLTETLAGVAGAGAATTEIVVA